MEQRLEDCWGQMAWLGAGIVGDWPHVLPGMTAESMTLRRAKEEGEEGVLALKLECGDELLLPLTTRVIIKEVPMRNAPRPWKIVNFRLNGRPMTIVQKYD